jgi:putative Holliday junction resolvase
VIRLGLDLGERRIGVAVSDPEGRVAVPSGVVERAAGDDRGIDAVVDLIRPWIDDYEIGEIVVGLPVRTDGTEGPEAHQARAEAAALSREVGIRVVVHDERFTSRIVHTAATGAGVSSRRRRGRIDDKAAAVMLQGYLDSRPDAGSR